jgi:hypothetical protein
MFLRHIEFCESDFERSAPLASAAHFALNSSPGRRFGGVVRGGDACASRGALVLGSRPSGRQVEDSEARSRSALWCAGHVESGWKGSQPPALKEVRIPDKGLGPGR